MVGRIMMSLKSFIPDMSKALQLSPHALYERQRVLVRSGLLPNIEGRGPGSGVRLSIDAVGTLLISMLATDDLSAAAEPTRRLAELKRVRPDVRVKPTSLGAAQSFRTVILKALSKPEICSKIHMINVDRTNLQVQISLYDNSFAEFGQSRGPWHNHRLWIASHISGGNLQKIGSLIADRADAQASTERKTRQ
jgi:hypothetical protein